MTTPAMILDFKSQRIHPLISFDIDMPRERDYINADGNTVPAKRYTWPLEYVSAGVPAGRSVRTLYRDASDDFAIYNGVNFASMDWFRPVGTFRIDVTPLNALDAFGRIMEMGDGTVAEKFSILRHRDQCVVRVETGNEQVVRLTAGPLIANQVNRIALGYSAGAWTLAVNGGDEVGPQQGAVPTVTQGQLGHAQKIASDFLFDSILYWDSLAGDYKGLSTL